jgi:hypothetical protein
MFCHECLAENKDSATRCIECGAKLHVVGKPFSEELQEKSLVANANVYGRVSGVIAAAFYVLFCAVALPQIFTQNIYFFIAVANAINDTSFHNT